MKKLWRLFREFKKFQKEKLSNKDFLEFQEFKKFQKEKFIDENYKNFIESIHSKKLLRDEVLGDEESLVSQKLLNSAELDQAISSGEFFLEKIATIVSEVDNSIMRKMLLNVGKISPYQGYLLGKNVYENTIDTLMLEQEIRHSKKDK